MAREVFGSVPGRARWACTGLLLAGLLWSSFGGVAAYVTVQDGADGVREYLSAYSFFVGVTSLVAMTLLLLRKAAGRIIAWCALPFLFVFVPIGTAIAVFVVLGLHSDDMRAHLQSSAR